MIFPHDTVFSYCPSRHTTTKYLFWIPLKNDFDPWALLFLSLPLSLSASGISLYGLSWAEIYANFWSPGACCLVMSRTHVPTITSELPALFTNLWSFMCNIQRTRPTVCYLVTSNQCFYLSTWWNGLSVPRMLWIPQMQCSMTLAR